ncbi:hypothetical protein OK807_11045, partial [Streptococcus pneumoniae]|nr:hypothetical protein [Streptococcus pneumoniae]
RINRVLPNQIQPITNHNGEIKANQWMFHCKFLIFLGKPIQPTALWQQVRSKDKLRFNVNTSSKVYVHIADQT